MTTAIQKKPSHDFLNVVQNKVILKDHTAENLFSLLLLSNPDLTLDEVMDDNQRVQAMRNLMAASNPSNFPYYEDAQCIFEDIQRFYDLCNQRIAEGKNEDGSKSVRKQRRRKRVVSPKSVVDLVVQCRFLF